MKIVMDQYLIVVQGVTLGGWAGQFNHAWAIPAGQIWEMRVKTAPLESP
jgi:hypothetical protein